MTTLPATLRTTPSRKPERVSYDTELLHSVLDNSLLCHLGLVYDGAPQVLPTLYVRVGETIYLHGSPAAGWLLDKRAAGRVCVEVTILDALVFTRSHQNHSANYRSVVVYGTPRPVIDEREKRAAMDALMEKVSTGRSAGSRAPSAKELAGVAVLAVELTEASVKVRAHGAVDEPADVELPYWAGVVPLVTTLGLAQPAEGVTVPVPEALRPARTSAWLEPVVLRGRHVVLEPLDVCHAADLYTALDHDDVHRYIPGSRPRDLAGMAESITAKLRDAALGKRVAWVQRDARSGAVIGTTSYCPPDEANRSVHIGSTQIARSHWRTGVNTEAKLMLMTHAFETLGAGRVELQTDCLNLRSQAAIERIGATREGVLRRHKRRADGSWRDSVFYGLIVDEWPAAKNRLVERLAGG